jgi:hypothetical protein
MINCFFYQKRRKRKSTDTSLLEQSCEIGLGTAVGSIFIFDVLIGEIKSHLVRTLESNFFHKSSVRLVYLFFPFQCRKMDMMTKSMM